MSKILVFGKTFIFLVSAAFLTACNNTAIVKTVDGANSAAAPNLTPASGQSSEIAADSERSYKIDFKSEPGSIQAGTPAQLSFTVKNRQGATIKDLQIVHEKPMHLLIVSKDLSEFYHVHPEQSADGSYRVEHSFPSGGDYRLYADFSPKAGVQLVEQIDIKVAGAERARVALTPDKSFVKTVDNLKVIMKPSMAIKAGQELMLDFQVFDAGTGKPATDLQNYLGELAHFVIISEDLKDFVHAHPISKGEHNAGAVKTNAMKADNHAAAGHASDGHDHLTMAGSVIKPSASEVSAHTAFPRAGLYKLWAQFQRGGRVISVPFIADVPAGSTEVVKAANVPDGATKITVSESGYSPDSISVEKGQPVKLAFYRADANNCGGEVVFEKQNITRKLPVGETVLVEFTPTETGEIGFTCGMRMYKGTITITD